MLPTLPPAVLFALTGAAVALFAFSVTHAHRDDRRAADALTGAYDALRAALQAKAEGRDPATLAHTEQFQANVRDGKRGIDTWQRAYRLVYRPVLQVLILTFAYNAVAYGWNLL